MVIHHEKSKQTQSNPMEVGAAPVGETQSKKSDVTKKIYTPLNFD